MPSRKVKVIYITGAGRSGSTLVARIVGMIPGVFCAGELRDLWRRGFLGDHLCGCGQMVRECETWRRIASAAYGALDADALHELNRLALILPRTRHLGWLLLPGGRQRLAGLWQAAARRLDALYPAIASVTGCSVIVDESKSPNYGYLVGMMPSVEMTVVHLVRDPRGVALSWLNRRMRRRGTMGNRLGGHFGLLDSARSWLTQNALTEMLWGNEAGRRLFVRYEDFVRDGQRSVEQIMALADHPVPASPVIIDGWAHIEASHIAMGNRSKFETGRIELRRDEAWRKDLTALEQRLVMALTLPLASRYGYTRGTDSGQNH